MNRVFAILSILVMGSLFTACQHRVFGVDEAVWTTLNESEREKVIDGYNRRKEIELANEMRQKEKELENQRHRQEVEAQTAPFYAAAGAVSSIWGSGKEQAPSFSPLHIESISSEKGKQVLTIGDTRFEVPFLSKMSQAWVRGQKVELLHNEADLLYPVKIRNLDNGESVSARKVKSR